MQEIERARRLSPETGPFSAVTFEEARYLHNSPSDELIEDILNPKFGLLNLMRENGQVYATLVLAEPDASDREFGSSPEDITDHYLHLSKFVRRYGMLHAADVKPQFTQELDASVDSLIERHRQTLRQDAEQAPVIIAKIGEGTFLDRETESAIRLYSFGSQLGLSFQAQKLFPIDRDLRKKSSIAGLVHSNVLVEPAGFIYANSNAAFAQGGPQAPKHTMRRIYLNPYMIEAPATLMEIMTRGDEAGLAFQAKIDIDMKMKYGFAKTEFTEPVRTEGIVLYGDEATADRLLRIVEGLYNEAPHIYKGRATPAVAHRVADGVAIADESLEKKASLNSHRAKAYNAIRRRILKEAGVSYHEKFSGVQLKQAIARFRQLHDRTLLHYGINPKNPAFNQSS